MRRWGVVLAVLSVLSFAVATPPAQASGYGTGSVVFTFTDTRINESSGAAVASLTPGVLFTHNDSGDAARFFAVGVSGETLATYGVAGAGAVDWEEMARGPASSGSGSSLYFADIGNNFRDRLVLDIYEVAEPVVAAGVDETLPVLSVRHLSYDDIPHDAEAFFVHPLSGEIVVVAKEFHGLSGVYVADGHVLRRVAAIAVPLMMPISTRIADASGAPQITGAAINGAGTKIVARTYTAAYEWDMAGSYEATFAARPRVISLPSTTQGEAITYAPDGALLTTTEGVRAPVHRLAPA